MSHYKRNAAANRDALFGNNTPVNNSSSISKPAAPRSSTATSTSSVTPTRTVANELATRSNDNNALLRPKTPVITSLSGTVKVAKMTEAEDCRLKAKKAMNKSLFSSPDPIAGGMYYLRAAEAYKACGEARLEKLCRGATAECYDQQGTYASAAAQYMRAAELVFTGEVGSSQDKERLYDECYQYFNRAANSWKNAGESGRAGEALMKGALSLLSEDDTSSDIVTGRRRLTKIDRKVLQLIEESVEIHVPDPLNRYRSMRQTGSSSYTDEDSSSKNSEGMFDERTISVCRDNVIRTSYAHETLFKAVSKLVEWGEISSALYTIGATSFLLETDSISSISLSRSYCVETILALALGDLVTAEKYFMHHLQKSSYLSSRECKLSEDLIRAVKAMDLEALEDARSPSGSNKAALSNLDISVRELVSDIRVAGIAKRTVVSNAVNKNVDRPLPLSALPLNDELDDDALQSSLNKNYAEMDDMMNDMGLNSDGEDEDGEESTTDDDDEFDLR